MSLSGADRARKSEGLIGSSHLGEAIALHHATAARKAGRTLTYDRWMQVAQAQRERRRL